MLARRPQRRETAAPAPRAGHSATVIPYYDEEAVLVLGGFDGDSVLALDEANVFVPSLERWEQLDTRPPMGAAGAAPPAPRAMHAAAMLGSTLIVHGGWGGDDVLRQDTCVLHLGTDPRWEAPSRRLALVATPSARQGHTLVEAPEDADDRRIATAAALAAGNHRHLWLQLACF
jgi:hypothetical protein